MSALPPKADIGCLLDYLVSDLITPVYARDTYWVIQNPCCRERRCLPLVKAFRPNLCASGAPEGLCCLCGGFESGVSILRRHRRGGLDIRQATSRGGGEYRRSSGLLVWELGDSQPVTGAEGQVPPDEPASGVLAHYKGQLQ